MANPKAFCSHRSVDKPIVMEVFRKLREAGIDAWVDEWEILPGQDFVDQINQGLEKCDAGLVFLSSASMAGKWQQAEISALTTMAVEENKPLIPVMLDADTPVPALLRSRSKLGLDQFDQIVDALYGRTHKPQLGPVRKKSSVYPFVIRLRSFETGQIGVSAVTEIKEEISEIVIKPGAAFTFSYMDFLKSRPHGSRQEGAAAIGTQAEKDLVKLGKAVGSVVFPEPVSQKLLDLMKKAAGEGGIVYLYFETDEAKLLSIPLEAARLRDGRAPALEPGVRVARRIGSAPPSEHALPGPLKMLIAVGAPDEGKTQSGILDLEQELQNILDAVADARQYGNAYVKILEVAHPKEITNALKERSYHVLHLSGHGQQGALELEDEDGNPLQVTAQDLADALIESDRPLPHVFLSGCHTGRGDSETVSLAQGLLERGVPSVLAMQAAVSDRYAIDLAKRFYASLSVSETPLVSTAIANARRELELERKKDVLHQNAESVPMPEYATPSLFLKGMETPLLDRSIDPEPVAEPARPRSTAAVPLLNIGDLVGRREEVRTIMRILANDSRAVEAYGKKSGCVLTGIGGVGKSTVAGRVMERMAGKGWFVVAISGMVNPGNLSITIGSAAMTAGSEGLQTLARPLADSTLSDEIRLHLLIQVLANHPILLILDNFEDNLVPGENEFQDPFTANLIQTLCRNARSGRLLVTSRHPLPGVGPWLKTLQLGPLSEAQTGKLFLRHARLKDAAPERLKLIKRVIGGHPRMIEYLDAILNQGRARLAVVEEKLRQYAEDKKIDLNQTRDDMGEAIGQALVIGAADIMLGELLDLADRNPGDRALLLQASVFPMPISREGLQKTLSIGGIRSGNDGIIEAVTRLAGLSLLTQLEGDFLWVHRWTAEALRSRMEQENYRQLCRNGGVFLKEEVAKTRSLETAIEAVRLLLNGQAWDESTAIARRIASFLQNYGQTIDLATFCSEVTTLLPRSHDQWPGFTGTEADALMTLGLGQSAFEKHQNALKGLEILVDREPDRADHLRGLSVSYNKMGDLHRALGQGQAAAGYHQKALEIAQRLADQEPDRADYLRGLSVSYSKMGDLHHTLGQGQAAAGYYQKALEIAQRLVDQEPDRADYQIDFVSSLVRTGNRNALEQGLMILTDLKKMGKLSAIDETKIAAIKELLSNTENEE